MVVRSLFCEATGVRAGIEQGETAGAVGRFDHAGRKTGLADQRRLLVAGDAVDRNGAAEQFGIGHAERGGAIQHVGKTAFGTPSSANSRSSQRPW